jgi:hypothetical protein
MTLTKRQMALAGLCAVGVAVFAYDRFQPADAILGPDTASASVTHQSAPVAEALAMTPTTSHVAAPDSPNSVLARRLKGLVPGGDYDASSVRDAFQPGRAWLARAPAAPTAEDPDKAKAEEFLRRHTLQAVLIAGEQRHAVIDFKCLNVGDTLEDFQVDTIRDRSAVLTSGAVRVTFQLPADK